MVAKQESDNSEDPQFIARVNSASDQVQASKCQRHLFTFFVGICLQKWFRNKSHGVWNTQFMLLYQRRYFCIRDITSVSEPLLLYQRRYFFIRDITSVSETILLYQRHYFCIRDITSVSETLLLYQRHYFCIRDITSFPCMACKCILLNKCGQKLYTFNLVTDILGT